MASLRARYEALLEKEKALLQKYAELVEQQKALVEQNVALKKLCQMKKLQSEEEAESAAFVEGLESNEFPLRTVLRLDSPSFLGLAAQFPGTTAPAEKHQEGNEDMPVAEEQPN